MSTGIRIRFVGLVLPALLAASACGGGGWIKDHPDLAARARETPGSFVEPARRQWRAISTFGASYTMRATRGIGGRSFDLYISLRRPDSIDILVLSPTGLGEAYLRANPAQVGMFVREDKVLYAGSTAGDAFARALGFELTVADAVALLLGYGADPDGLPPGVSSWDEKARRIRVDHGSGVSVWLHPPTGHFDRVEHRDRLGGVTAEVLEWVEVAVAAVAAAPVSTAAGLEVADLESAEAGSAERRVSIPSLVRLDVEPDGLRLQLRLVGVPAVNPDYPPGYFDLQFPPGIAVFPLEDLAREGGLFRRSLPAQRP